MSLQSSEDPTAEIRRFTGVAVAGLVVDLMAAWFLVANGIVSLPVAAVFGFVAGAAFNYLLHELWTFQSGARALSIRRALYFGGATLATLAVRVVAVLFLAWVVGIEGFEIVILFAAAMVSFTVNFVLSKSFVFRPVVRQPKQNATRSTHPEDTIIQTSPSIDTTDWAVPEHEVQDFMPRKHDYALVVPVINEGERIRRQLKETHTRSPQVDVVIADGGSTDGSLDSPFLSSVGVRALLTKTGPGKLSAQLCMAYAWCLLQGYKGVVTVDGNGKDGLDAINAFVAHLDDGADYVQGSRYLPGGKAEHTPLERTIANRFFHAPLMSIAGRHWFTDTTNGFRGYSAGYLLHSAVQPFRPIFDRYELLFYLTIRAGQLGLDVRQQPVRRSYPWGEATPTKITGLGPKLSVLRQTVDAVLGRYHPS